MIHPLRSARQAARRHPPAPPFLCVGLGAIMTPVLRSG